MRQHTVTLCNGSSLGLVFAEREAARQAAAAASASGDVFAISCGKRSWFYLMRGKAAYPISAEAAAVELAMVGV